MPNHIDYTSKGEVDYLQPTDPHESVVGARVGHEWCNTSTGIIWTCINDTFGSQLWTGSDGSLSSAIADPNNPDLRTLFTMDNITGNTLNNESGGALYGTLVGPVAVPGLLGNALEFDSLEGDHVELYSIPGSLSATETICGWVHDVQQSGQFFSYRSGSNLIQFAVNTGSIGVLTRGSTGTLYNHGYNTSVFTDGDWHLVGYVLNRTAQTVDLYVDGVRVVEATGVNTGSIASSKASIGELSYDSTQRIKANIDQFRWFSKALTPAEMTILYNNGQGI